MYSTQFQLKMQLFSYYSTQYGMTLEKQPSESSRSNYCMILIRI